MLCRRFADGFPNLYVDDASRVRNKHVAFLASFQNVDNIFEQLSVIYQLPRMFVGSFTLVLPYFPTGTAERVHSITLSHISTSHVDHMLMGPDAVCCWFHWRHPYTPLRQQTKFAHTTYLLFSMFQLQERKICGG